MTDRYDPRIHEDDWDEPEPVPNPSELFQGTPVTPGWSNRPTTVGQLVGLLGSIDPDVPIRFDYDPALAGRSPMIDMYLRLVLEPSPGRRSVVFLLSEAL